MANSNKEECITFLFFVTIPPQFSHTLTIPLVRVTIMVDIPLQKRTITK